MLKENRKILDQRFTRLHPEKRRKIFLKVLCSIASNSSYAELLPGAMVSLADEITTHFIAAIQQSKYNRDGNTHEGGFANAASRLSFARRLCRTFFNLQLTLKRKWNEIQNLFQRQKDRFRNL